MAFLVGGANSAADTGYDIDNSLRFNDDDSPYLNLTPSSAGNRRTFTLSVWAKRGDVSAVSPIIIGAGTAATDMAQMGFQGDYTFIIQDRVSSTNNLSLTTDAFYRDPSAWYHIVVHIDTTQGTDTNRAKLWINGVAQTFSSATYPSQNYDCHFNNTVAHHIGAQSRGGTNDHFDGYLAEFHWIDGSNEAYTEFGETDEDSGIWKPKKYSGSYGDEGFFLEFKETGTNQDSSGIGADTSGEDNHFAVTNLAATDQCTDTPTNNFCTANPLQRGYPPSYLVTLKEGNLQVEETSENWIPYASTIGVQNGKWYWECENVSGEPAAGFMFGIQAQEGGDIHGIFITDNRYPGYYISTVGFSYHASGTYYYNETSTESGSVSYTNGDTIMLALDMDNGFLYAGKNGTWNDSGDPTSGGSGTGNAYSGFAGKTITPCNALNGSSVKAYLNFGNPVVANDSSNSDGNGYGDFEYAVPSGYYALCTKNLAEYG